MIANVTPVARRVNTEAPLSRFIRRTKVVYIDGKAHTADADAWRAFCNMEPGAGDRLILGPNTISPIGEIVARATVKPRNPRKGLDRVRRVREDKHRAQRRIRELLPTQPTCCMCEKRLDADGLFRDRPTLIHNDEWLACRACVEGLA